MLYRKKSLLTLITFLLANSSIISLCAEPAMPADQDAFAQIISELEQMPEDKLEELNQQLQAEVKRELEKKSPEELALFKKEMEDFWRAQGVDPAMLPPLEELMGIQPETQTNSVSMPQQNSENNLKPEIPLTPTHTSSEVAATLAQLLNNLESLRKKIALYPNLTHKLHVWREGIDDLVYYIKIINKPEHYERLSGKEFEQFFNTLKTLHDHLITLEPKFISSTKLSSATIEDPYETLRISAQATDAEIKEAYGTYIKENSPETLQAKLTAEGLTPEDIEGRLKSAQLGLHTIQEAYEKISDPQIRAQTNRTMAAEHEQQHATEKDTQNTLSHIVNALSQAIYQRNILEEIQKFLEKYEPTQFALKKKMEEAELKRRQEQEAASKIRPTSSPSTSYEPRYPQPSSYLPGSDAYYPSYGGGYGNNYYDYDQPSYGYEGNSSPDGAERSSGRSGGGSRGSGTSKSTATPEEGGTDKDGKTSGGNKSNKDKSQKENKKVSPEEWNKALQELDQELAGLDSFLLITESNKSAAEKIDPLITKFRGNLDKFNQHSTQLEQQTALIEQKRQEESAAEEIEAEEPEEATKKTIAENEVPQLEQKLQANIAMHSKSAEELQEEARSLNKKFAALVEKAPNMEAVIKKTQEFSAMNKKMREEKTMLPQASSLWDKVRKKYTNVFGLLDAAALVSTLAQPVTQEPKAKSAFATLETAPATEENQKTEKYDDLVKALVKVDNQLRAS